MPCAELLSSPEIVFDEVANALTFVAVLEARNYLIANPRALPKAIYNQAMANFAVILPVEDAIAARADFKEGSKLRPPRNITEMRNHPEKDGYLASWYKELDGYRRNGCDIPADMPIGDIPPELILQLMPIFSKKYEGTDFAKFKCRLVVLGNRWKNIHSTDTYTSMVKMDTIKFLLALAAAEDYDLVTLDVCEAFLTTTVPRE